jgi:hypothetical protein
VIPLKLFKQQVPFAPPPPPSFSKPQAIFTVQAFEQPLSALILFSITLQALAISVSPTPQFVSIFFPPLLVTAFAELWMQMQESISAIVVVLIVFADPQWTQATVRRTSHHRLA